MWTERDRGLGFHSRLEYLCWTLPTALNIKTYDLLLRGVVLMVTRRWYRTGIDLSIFMTTLLCAMFHPDGLKNNKRASKLIYYCSSRWARIRYKPDRLVLRGV
jgi:hypothetical protein